MTLSTEGKKPGQLNILYPAKLSFKNKGQITTLPDEQVWRAFIPRSHLPRKKINGVLQAEVKGR